MDKIVFPSRTMGKKETWTKKRACGFYMPDEYTLCDNCLERKFFDDLYPSVSSGGCSCCAESGYTTNQVTQIIRRVLGEMVVLL